MLQRADVFSIVSWTVLIPQLFFVFLFVLRQYPLQTACVALFFCTTKPPLPPPPPRTGCFDKNTLCYDWAVIGECEANKGYMSKWCRLSCNFCNDLEIAQTGQDDDDGESVECSLIPTYLAPKFTPRFYVKSTPPKQVIVKTGARCVTIGRIWASVSPILGTWTRGASFLAVLVRQVTNRPIHGHTIREVSVLPWQCWLFIMMRNL